MEEFSPKDRNFLALVMASLAVHLLLFVAVMIWSPVSTKAVLEPQKVRIGVKYAKPSTLLGRASGNFKKKSPELLQSKNNIEDAKKPDTPTPKPTPVPKQAEATKKPEPKPIPNVPPIIAKPQPKPVPKPVVKNPPKPPPKAPSKPKPLSITPTSPVISRVSPAHAPRPPAPKGISAPKGAPVLPNPISGLASIPRPKPVDKPSPNSANLTGNLTLPKHNIPNLDTRVAAPKVPLSPSASFSKPSKYKSFKPSAPSIPPPVPSSSNAGPHSVPVATPTFKLPDDTSTPLPTNESGTGSLSRGPAAPLPLPSAAGLPGGPGLPGSGPSLSDQLRSTAGARYNGALKRVIENNLSAPEKFASRLQFEIVLTIGLTGKLEAFKTVKSSDNQAFDTAVLNAIKISSFPELPEDLAADPPYIVAIVVSP